MRKFFVRIEIIAQLKNAARVEVVKNFKKIGWQSSKLKHSLQFTIKLVIWKMCSISSNPPKETPASATSRSPAFTRYLKEF